MAKARLPKVFTSLRKPYPALGEALEILGRTARRSLLLRNIVRL